MASQYSRNEHEAEAVLDERELDENEELDDDEMDREMTGHESEKDGGPEDFSVTARQRLRDELSRQVEAFLAGGGRIREIPSNFNHTRPNKPVSDYGDRLM